LELCYAKKVTLRESFTKVYPDIDGAIKINDVLSNGRGYRIKEPRHDEGIATFPDRE
jgi:hypothetical protein